jgi:glycosyltransferase involved in cell wall biosynthesis
MSARLKINVFTPLPPVRSEIANVNVAVLRRLAKDADVTIWVPQELWSLSNDDGITVRPFRADAICYGDLNNADATFFNIGNNLEAHQDIYDVALRFPGIIVLHDLSLFHFMLELHAQGCSYSYYDALERCHGAGAAVTMQRAFADGTAHDGASRFPMTLAPARMATSLLVHNSAAIDGLTAESRMPVDYLPLPLTAEGDMPPPRRTPQRPYRLVIFGFLGSNRRVEAIVHVLAASPVQAQFTLDIFGPYFDSERLNNLIPTLGLAGRVTLHGFVSDERLDQAIADADLAINLRYPSMGEASASQLRIWVNGTPSLVTRTQWYATIPEDCVHFIGVDTETDDLNHALFDFCCNPGRYQAAGVNGWHHVRRNHSVAQYAEGMLGIAARDRSGRRSRLAKNLAARLKLPARHTDAGWIAVPDQWQAISDALHSGVTAHGPIPDVTSDPER